MDEKAVCFACGTEFHLLVTYILSTTVYSHKRKILFLVTNPRLLKYLDSVFDIHLWEEIIIIDPLTTPEVINQQIQQWLPSIDILHFFSWGYWPCNKLFVACCIQKKKIILTDEGIDTYIPFKRFKQWQEREDPARIMTNGVDLTKVDEIWLFNPLLYQDQNLIPIKRIDIELFFQACLENNQFVKDFKSLFKICDDIVLTYDIVYFRQYYSLINRISYAADSFLDKLFCELLSNNNVFIKNHPAFTENSYVQNIGQPLFLDVPWEVLLILARIDDTAKIQLPHVFISTTSSAMFSTNTLGLSGDFIFLYKIIELYTDFKDATIEKLINISKRVFPNSRFYEPKNLKELYELLSEIINKKGFSPINQSLNQLMEEENSWLQEQYVNFWQKQKDDDEKLIQEQTLAAQVAKCEQTIQNLTSQVAERDQTVQNLTSQVAECDQTVRNLTSQVAEREQAMKSLSAQTVEHNQTIQSLVSQLSELEQAVKSLSAQVAKREQIIQSQTAQINQLTRELDKTKTEAVNYALSRSWRITRPLRKFKDYITRVKNA